MLNKLLLHAIPLLLPFAAYAVWLALARRRAVAGKAGTWRDAPFAWLTLAGLVLVIASLAAVALFTGDEVGGSYTPARYIDGKVVPGETR